MPVATLNGDGGVFHVKHPVLPSSVFHVERDIGKNAMAVSRGTSGRFGVFSAPLEFTLSPGLFISRHALASGCCNSLQNRTLARGG